MMPNFEYTHRAEKARDTTLDDKNASQHYDVCCSDVTAFSNQHGAFASELGDDQSR